MLVEGFGFKMLLADCITPLRTWLFVIPPGEDNPVIYGICVPKHNDGPFIGRWKGQVFVALSNPRAAQEYIKTFNRIGTPENVIGIRVNPWKQMDQYQSRETMPIVITAQLAKNSFSTRGRSPHVRTFKGLAKFSE